MIRYILLSNLFLIPSLAFGQAEAKIVDPDPEIERKSFQVAEGFEVNLFAADPLLAKPIQMNFDSRGRLWVASSEIYPHIKPGQKANDKIIILEDTNNDGKADKTTVFADGLLIPTGVEPGDGGAYVANSTELLHLSASKEGGKADKSRVVLSGFGTEDTHHILHTFRWGPDGMLYFNQSIYIHSHLETPHGVRRLNGGGIWKFRPETMELEVFVRGFVNTWGHHFDRYGQSMITDGAYGEGINHGVPGAYYFTAVGAVRILNGMNPGSPKHCGLEVISGSHLPEDWRGNVLTNDFRGHRVCRFVLKEDGSSFASQERPELIKTNHPAFRPIDIKMGPDGAIYIADWYNPIIQHGEIDFRDPRRDHTHGRIWRITAKGRDLVKKPDLVNATPEALLNYLKSPEDWTRHHAKRVMKERGAKEILTPLGKWISNLDPKHPEYENHLLEGLWTYQSLDVVNGELLEKVLSAKEGKIRAAATRVLAHWQSKIPNGMDLLRKSVADEHPRVRMEAVRALSEVKNAKAAEVALQALDRPVDKILDYALWLTSRDLEPYWMAAFKEGSFDFGGDPKKVAFALSAVGSQSAVAPLLNLAKSGKLPKDRVEPIWVLIAQLGGAKELQAAFQRVFSSETTTDQKAALLTALEESVRQRKVRPDGDLIAIRTLIQSDNEKLKTLAIRLAGLWKQEALRNDLLELAKSEKGALPIRQAAIDGLNQLGGQATKDSLVTLSGKAQPIAIRKYAIIALANLDTPLAVKQTVQLIASVPASDELLDIYGVFVQRKGGADLLAKALEGQKLQADVAKFGIRAVRASGQEYKVLLDALTKAGNLSAQKNELTPKELSEMVNEVLKKGDPARGELIYRRKDTLCLTCHSIGGAGGQVGPELASIGASAPVDYLIESLLIPNKAVKEGYHALRITTLDGKLITGVKIRETKTDMVLRTAEDKEVKILQEDIESKAQTRSLMPDGLVDSLTRQELLDLVRYLSELGKVGPYSLSKSRIIRRWEILDPTEPAKGEMRRSRLAATTSNNPVFKWDVGYGMVSGLLPLDAIPKFNIFSQTIKHGVVRAQLDVTTGGKIKLKLNSTKGLTLWVGSNPVALKEETILDLKLGLQTLTFGIDFPDRVDGLLCEIEDVPDSPARLSIVGGK